MPRCTARKTNGEQCSGRAPEGGAGFCYFHDPQNADERTAARSRGGRTRNRPAATLGPDTPDLQLQSVADVVVLLAATINQVRRGQIAPKVSNAVALLASTLLRAIEGGDLEDRIKALEAQTEERGRQHAGGNGRAR